ncbi:hypothetical protein ACIGEZ_00275 [Streptomyces sp. NPDC085481]|uniref:hypothetical protein n=1 Tax=Streptomyces sp. NPDC085481 TaxID=3365727 RepID=UPI0037D8FA43
MTTAEAWRTTDRLLPLGGPADGAWIAERAVRALLAETARGVRGVVPALPRFRLAGEAGAAAGPRFPVPPGGLPAGELRIALEFAARLTVVSGRPLPELADALRAALLGAAEGLGLVVAGVDLRVTELLDDAPGDPAPAAPPPGRTSPPTPDDPAAMAALAVPGVAALTDVFGAPLRRAPGLLRVELAVTADHRAVEVCRAVRTAVTAAAPGATTVTVLVSELR